jgi:hypothetical protein
VILHYHQFASNALIVPLLHIAYFTKGVAFKIVRLLHIQMDVLVFPALIFVNLARLYSVTFVEHPTIFTMVVASNLALHLLSIMQRIVLQFLYAVLQTVHLALLTMSAQLAKEDIFY